jgi:hypothetical protein
VFACPHNDKVEIIMTKGGERKREVLKKHDLITVHTATRSFATNAYLQNVPTIFIMKITGLVRRRAFLSIARLVKRIMQIN